VTVAPGILEILLAKYPLDHGNACVVRNIPGDWEPIGEIAKGLKMMDTRRVIAYSGRITTGRNLELLIKTAPELGFPHRLCLLGYGPPVYIQRLVNQAKLCDVQLEIFEPVHPSSVVASLELANIVFVGVENVAKSYELALPNKFFEAILSGRPVVAPNLPEMMKFGESLPGIFWYEPSSTSLSEALTRAENSMSLPPEMIEERMEKVRWSSEARQLVDLYESLVSLNS
jgi:glycosyltransferase involved in cell wall biosynthesis